MYLLVNLDMFPNSFERLCLLPLVLSSPRNTLNSLWVVSYPLWWFKGSDMVSFSTWTSSSAISASLVVSSWFSAIRWCQEEPCLLDCRASVKPTVKNSEPINLFNGFRVLNVSVSFLLAGRVLLIFLFLGFILQGSWSLVRVFVSIIGLAACVMVAVGFKAKWSAAFLVLVLSVFNVFANNWWSVHSAHPQRDFLK